MVFDELQRDGDLRLVVNRGAPCPEDMHFITISRSFGTSHASVRRQCCEAGGGVAGQTGGHSVTGRAVFWKGDSIAIWWDCVLRGRWQYRDVGGRMTRRAEVS